MAAATEPRLVVDGLGKTFARELPLARRYGISDIAGELRGSGERTERALRPGEFWALQDVGFTVQPGEALGIIGHNGAGKSTLLRLLTGLVRPTLGTIDIQGSVSALLDLSAPFNRLLTGRENVISTAAIRGLDPASADELVAAVADFAELGDTIEAPMWTYSTGMQMRLGFAIAAQAEPDLLLVDEVIAVGDIGFQRKCVAHIRRHLARGGALVLVSHDLWMIQALCARCLVMANGGVILDTQPNQAISAYMRTLRRGNVYVGRDRSEPPEVRAVTATVAVDSVVCSSPDGQPPRTNEPLEVEFTVRAVDEPVEVTWHLDLLAANLQACVSRLGPGAEDEPIRVDPAGATVCVHIPALPLFPGIFHIQVHLTDPLTGEERAELAPPTSFEVESASTRLETLAQISNVMTTLDGSFESPAAQS